MGPGTNLKNRYTLGRYPLAHKGMGEVWPARDVLLDRQVIVKVVDSARMDADLLRRFRREALLTVRLEHPGVPAVYDLDSHDGRPYVVLERIDGITLADLVAEQGPIPFGWVAAIGAQISAVLLAARELGLVHRDIKPANVMLDRHGAVKVLDFGLAVVRDDDRYSRITRTGQALGTVGYMAPEQIVGGPTDHRTDLYGLGATLFDLLTGRPPFDGATTLTTVRRQLDGPPPRPGDSRPDTPAGLDDLVHALLATEPRERPASAADVYAALAPLAEDLPPIPGVLTDAVTPVRAWAAIVGRAPLRTRPTPPTVEPPEPAGEPTAAHAARSHAAGEYRAAARQWRRLAEDRVQRYGEGDPKAFGFRLNVARAHAALGEHARALRLFQSALGDWERAVGPGHPTVRQLRREIARFSAEPSQVPRYAPDVGD
ncbi:protein kinase [Micromonospora sp. WMMD882]|uniref:serine/threonine-protein kinase n=1 Tax=Micromonospora sp. WMMD882 TaxID=3015151 RepID=UPI00248BB087|nr:protein kinase [Micromonospora sp. WMMD882]WBB79290.1 protein kinase [Micromonospora sp. WMMD882]